MADIYDTLHPVNTPADNLYPNIKPEQNIPDASISKQKLNFSVGGQGAAAILPCEEYVDIAYNGNPGSVLFPKGTYFIYTRDGWLNNTPPYTGTYNTVSEDFNVMAYWYDVSENLIKSSEADPSDDGIILSIPEDDFLVMVLIKNPNENGPRVIPVYSIIPTSLIKYDTRDYDWAALQVTGFTINDGEYPQLGSGYLVDQFRTPVVSANTNYYKICNMKILSADIGRDIVSASAIVWIAATTGSTINTAFVSLNLVMDTQTQDYSASGATLVGGAFDAGKLVYTIEFDADKSELTIELYAALSKDAMLAAGNVCYVRYRDAQGDRQSTVPFFYGTDTGSASAPSNSIPVKQIGTAFNPEGAYPNLGAGKDGDGNQISTTYAKQTGSYPTLGAGYLAKRYDLQTDGAQQGWLKIGTVPFSTVAQWYEYSCIMLVHGIFRGSSTAPEGKAPKTALIEIEGRRYLNSLGNTRIGVLMGDVPKENLCFVIEENLDMSIYIYNDYVERITTTFEILSEGESPGNTVISPANIFQWNSNFVTALPSAPEGAVYAVNRNNADCDGDGNVISKTYAPIASPEFTGTPTAPTPPAGDNSTRIATTGWVQSTSGAKTAYHHHIQAELRSAQPEPTAHYNTTASAYFEIVTDSADPITSSADLYDALMGLAWTTTETRWTPATGGLWVDEIPDDPDMYPSAWPVVGIRALAQARPDDPGIDSRSIKVMVYRVGKTMREGPLQQVPFYYSGFASRPSYIHDTVTDQYGTYIAGGD